MHMSDETVPVCVVNVEVVVFRQPVEGEGCF